LPSSGRVPETPEELYERVQEQGLRMPPVEDWETWPFDGALRPRGLQPPVDVEKPRLGEGGSECWRCARGEDGAIWSDERWLLTTPERNGLPVVVILESRAHLDFGDLDDEHAADLGRMLVRVERAVRHVPHVGRVHVCRWGDGSAHLHYWLLARPARFPQLIGSFAAIWDDVLPPTPRDVWDENLALVARALNR
jgi:diadenosine tetraphosphate (Ap4A) HIT family hydrolase